MPRFLVLLLLIAAVFAACGDDDDTPSPTPSSGSPSPSPTASPVDGSETPTLTSAPTPALGTYTVQAGDTLYSIAQRFGTTVDAIAAENGIVEPSQIEAGTVLLIPGTSPGQTLAPTQAPTPGPTSAPGGPAQVVSIGDTSRDVVAFTFDAGADAGYTVLILDTLKANGITASFGMTGKWAETYPDLLRRIVNEGHTLINHSYDHPSFTGASAGDGVPEAERWDQLERTEDIVQQIAGATTKPYFRPPFGDYDASVNEDVGAIGYQYNIMWTVDSRGWTGIPEPQIQQRCLDLSEPGAIYIFHVGAASADGPALQGIIDGLRAQGYEIGDINAVLN